MDEQQIQDIVNSVLGQLGEKTVNGKIQVIPQAAPAPAATGS